MADGNFDAFAQAAELSKKVHLLQEQLQSKDRELASMRELVEAQKDLGSADATAAKVGELSKKVRELNLQQGKDRALIEKLKKELEEAKRGSGGPITKFRPGEGEGKDSEIEQMKRDIKSLKEKNNAALERAGKLEAQMKVLQQERDRLLLALKAEVGEEYTVEQILKELADGKSSWVGRSQQLALLKDKIKELQKAQGMVQDSKVERDNLERIRKIRADKVQKEEQVAVELEKARKEIADLKLKYDSTASRVKITSEDNKDLRGKLQTVLDKTLNDDKLINALKAQLDMAKRQLRDQGKVQETDRFVLEELEALRARSQQQEAQIDRQQGIIVQLQDKLKQQGSGAAPPSGVVQRVTGRMPPASGSRPGSSIGLTGSVPPGTGGGRPSIGSGASGRHLQVQESTPVAPEPAAPEELLQRDDSAEEEGTGTGEDERPGGDEDE